MVKNDFSLFFKDEIIQYCKIVVTTDVNDLFSSVYTVYCPVQCVGVYVNDFISKHGLIEGAVILIVPVTVDEYDSCK